MTNFFSSGLRQKVDQLMDILWSGGVNNPMDSIEQISYLLFLRLLTERDEQLSQLDKKRKRIFSGEWTRYAWGNFVTLTGDQLFDATRGATVLFGPASRPLPQLPITTNAEGYLVVIFNRFVHCIFVNERWHQLK